MLQWDLCWNWRNQKYLSHPGVDLNLRCPFSIGIPSTSLHILSKSPKVWAPILIDTHSSKRIRKQKQTNMGDWPSYTYQRKPFYFYVFFAFLLFLSFSLPRISAQVPFSFWFNQVWICAYFDTDVQGSKFTPTMIRRMEVMSRMLQLRILADVVKWVVRLSCCLSILMHDEEVDFCNSENSLIEESDNIVAAWMVI